LEMFLFVNPLRLTADQVGSAVGSIGLFVRWAW
jgi:hypothetical protein